MIQPTAVLFDLDSTLAESKQPITKPMAQQLAQLSKKMPFGVISGGQLSQLVEQVINELPPNASLSNIYLFPTSGAALYVHRDGEWTCVYSEDLHVDESGHVEEVLEDALHRSNVVDLTQKSWGERIEARGTQVTLSALGQEAPLAEKKAWDPTGEKRETLRMLITGKLPDYTVTIGGTTSIDVTKKGIDKAYGVRQFAVELHTKVSSLLYVGDALQPGGNDHVVIATGVPTAEVKGPADTMRILTMLISGNYTHTPAATPLALAELTSSLQNKLTGDVVASEAERALYSHDTSLFARTPSLVVYPRDAADVVELVKEVAAAKKRGESVSVTARSAGTDMSGGPLTTSIVAVFTKYMNRLIEVKEDAAQGVVGFSKVTTKAYAVVEPGMYYRDFEKQTLAKGNLVLPSYPASRELCAIGGIVNNNSGGERTLEYGKTEEYVDEIETVLADGSLVTFKALTKDELAAKKAQQDFEGEIYRKMDALLTRNAERIAQAKPKVSKNSAGYYLWNVKDEQAGTFNLAKLICGAQGTLGLMTKAKLRLVKEETHRAMLVIFLKDLAVLPEIVHRVLPFNPESFESYDDKTFSLAIKFMPQMLAQMGFTQAAKLGISFLPEVGMAITGGIPKLVLMAEFSAESAEAAEKAAEAAEKAVADLNLPTSVKRNEQESEKYWIVRRESFALLRKHANGLYASPFIDDFVVPPDCYPQFLPELYALLEEYSKYFIYTIAGHIGNGNFHIIPLMDLSKPEVRNVILELSPKVYELVLKYGGTTTGEHNDGIIRTPYLPMQFGDEIVKLFEETKAIFDPLDIFNPGKKVHGTFDDIKRDMLRSS